MNRTTSALPSQHLNKMAGFSLVEIAIVLVIVGLLIGGLLVPLSAQIEKKDRDETRRTLNEIREAIEGFAMANNRLPCPDTDGDGQENRGATCTQAEGDVPWQDLGVGRQDSWLQPLTYRVTTSFADNTDGTGCTTPTPGVSFSLCSNGDITVLDARGGNIIAQNSPAIIVSHGKNWAATNTGAIDPDEFENENNDQSFVSKAFSNASGSAFDDLVVWLSPYIIKSKMVKAGKLP